MSLTPTACLAGTYRSLALGYAAQSPKYDTEIPIDMEPFFTKFSGGGEGVKGAYEELCY